MITEIIARNMWIASKRSKCEYFEDMQDLIEQWPISADREKILLNAKNFIDVLKLEYPMVYDFVWKNYCES